MAVVMLTGASGFLGIHVLQRLLDEGNHVRALVRTPAKLRDNLALLGVDADDSRIEVVRGDMTDSASVREAARGCDQCVHAAATYSYVRRDAERIRRENKTGTATVLDAAVEAGCEGIVHVSSIVALLQRGATLTNESPLGLGLGPYTQSKVESERIARERQDVGAPVSIVNPGAIIGPHDPYLGETNAIIRDVLLGRAAVFPRGRLQFVDVRDTAEVVVAALARPGGRYLVPGENVSLPHEVLRLVTGRRLPARSVPLKAVLPLLQLGYRTGWSWLPHSVEGSKVLALNTRVDASGTTNDLGVVGRALADSVRDSVRWLAEAGHIPPAAAGRCLQTT